MHLQKSPNMLPVGFLMVYSGYPATKIPILKIKSYLLKRKFTIRSKEKIVTYQRLLTLKVQEVQMRQNNRNLDRSNVHPLLRLGLQKWK